MITSTPTHNISTVTCSVVASWCSLITIIPNSARSFRETSSNASLRATKPGTRWCRRKLPTSSAAAAFSDTRNIKALPASDAAYNRRLTLYFAYGSNMDWAQMKERCPFAKFVCRAKLPSHRLAFTLRSYSRRCGVADILRDETREVWGVVYELRESELKNLDKDEDFNPGRPDDQNEYTRDLLRMARGRCETAAPRCTFSWPSAAQSHIPRWRVPDP